MTALLPSTLTTLPRWDMVRASGYRSAVGDSHRWPALRQPTAPRGSLYGPGRGFSSPLLWVPTSCRSGPTSCST